MSPFARLPLKKRDLGSICGSARNAKQNAELASAGRRGFARRHFLRQAWDRKDLSDVRQSQRSAWRITDKLEFIVGIGPLASGKQARFMDENLFGVTIPPATIERIEAADDEKAEGRKICVELMEAYQNIEDIAGVHIMAPMQGAKAIAETIRMSGLR